MHGTIEVAAELRTLFIDAHQWSEGDHLKSTGVGQDRAIPLHEIVEPPETLHPLMSWAQVEVIRVRQNDLRAKRFQILRVE